MVLRLSVAVSLVALLALAGLQYHWIGQIAVAERQRLERSVAESSEEFAEDLLTELRSLYVMLEPRPAFPSDPASIASRYKEWMATATYPAVLKNLYLAQGASEVLKYDTTSGAFENTSWPKELSAMADWAARRDVDEVKFGTDAFLIPVDRRGGGPGRGGRGFRGGPGPGGGPPPGLRGGGQRGFPPPPPREQEEERWLVVELNRDAFVSQIFPMFTMRRFPEYEGQKYRVAVVETEHDTQKTLFTSSDAWSTNDLASPDYRLELLTPFLPRRGPGPQEGPPRIGGPPRGGGGGQRERRIGLVDRQWDLLVKHQAGSVEIAAMQFRQRNLAISFGVLVVLAIGAVAMVVSGHRARRLGKLQMEFAAGVSHELRTPLAVIQNAAHNLGSGVVNDREGIAEYAAIVQGEARRLTEMVEQVMAYTETQSGRKRYDIAPVDVSDIADIAIRHMSIVLQEGSATLQKRIDAGLPPVMADAPALTRCLQNLLSNAVKYGRNNYSVQVEVEGKFVPVQGTPGKVQLSVVDHGTGVPEGDVSHLFEAFYRGSNASTNTPGNGLGLHLVHRIMEAQNGSVTYTRMDDGGARFTLTLPAAKGPA
jgi:signal transduction histidine kinase